MEELYTETPQDHDGHYEPALADHPDSDAESFTSRDENISFNEVIWSFSAFHAMSRVADQQLRH